MDDQTIHRVVKYILKGIGVGWLAVNLIACAATPQVKQDLLLAGQIQVEQATASTVQMNPSPDRAAALSVMTYNVAGLPFPVALGRDRAVERIAIEIGRMALVGEQPDVLVVQEAFVRSADLIGRYGQYPYSAKGPDAVSQADLPIHPGTAALRKDASFWSGETVGAMLPSGLRVFSRFPIVDVKHAAFDACAGFDCLARKGIVRVRIDVPGVPDPVEIVTAHLNAQAAAGVPEDRSLAAHRIQMDELAAFLALNTDPFLPLIMGADLNTKRSQDRILHASARLAAYTGVRDFCMADGSACAFQLPEEERKPWLAARDIQAFRSGSRVTVEPLSAQFMFEAPVAATGKPMSDHPAVLVFYNLTWDAPYQVADGSLAQ